MFAEESIEDRQNNEFEALKGIYEENLFDLRKKNINEWQPLEFKITLTPLSSDSGLKEINVQLDLHVKCCKNYPNVVPKLTFENVKGISRSTLSEFKTELVKKCTDLVGEEMIFDLAEHIKEFLYDNNKPAAKSFYDEMVQRQELLKEQEEEKKKEESDRKQQSLLKEIQERQKERQEIIKQEYKKEREKQNSINEDINQRRNSLLGRKSTLSNEGCNEILCAHPKPASIEFTNYGGRLINCYQCLEHCDNTVKLVGVDNLSGQLFLLTEWTIDTASDFATISKNIASIEKEMNYLVKLKHGNLLHYLNIKQKLIEEEKKMKVYVLQEFNSGLNLHSLYFLEEVPVPVQIDKVRYLAGEVLNALDFLHRNKVVHKNLSSECIYMDKLGVIKVSNYSLDKRLGDLITSSSASYSKQTDIFNFGLLCLSLIKGSINDKNTDIPTNLSREVHDFLEKCLNTDEKDQLKGHQLLNHLFLKAPLQVEITEQLIPEKRESSSEIKTDNIGLFTQGSNIGPSRFENEFQCLDQLGKGAYGVVFKVQNRLDQQFYAIKRIQLIPKSKQLTRKIIREVKLLSCLNHENVVRYFNSWIETAVVDRNQCESILTNTTSSVKKDKESLSDGSSLDKFAPQVQEWSIYYSSKASKSKVLLEQVSSSSESSDDDDNFNLFEESDSEMIQFDHGNVSNISEKNEAVDTEDNADPIFSQTKEIQFMYIQMEFCEKSTLRTAIDNNLYLDTERMWRLFREIVEGLAYIHQLGMIHRDLKPVNIFLDSNDHVKIGDFGLATTNLLTKNDNEVMIDSTDDQCMTGHIGTALYIAPEVTPTAEAKYNNKVDIYSLGVIFFEMCYKPLSTGMERVAIINNIRQKNILFPSDFNEKKTSNQEIIIRWLLDHNVVKRPTSEELLQSDYIPPPEFEDGALREVVRHTLGNTNLRSYKYLIDSFFGQTPTLGQDITYDQDMSTYNINKNLLYNHINKLIIKIFEVHGGLNLPTPLLMPKSKYYDKIKTCVKLMNHSGSIVSIPHDLRVPFARYVARNNITSLRRYSIDRVYREQKKVLGCIPRELHECMFDIVGSTADVMAEAELIFILNQIVDEIPGLRNKKLRIRINHVLLIKAIFLHCGIKDNHNELLHLLSEGKEGIFSTQQVTTYLTTNGSSDNSIESLLFLLKNEIPVNEMMSSFKIITKKHTEAAKLAIQALQDLKALIYNTDLFGVTFNIVIAPALLHNVKQYSGMMYQLVCKMTKKLKQGFDVFLAAGGRYDGMINDYQKMRVLSNVGNKAVGISISMDKLIQAMDKEDNTEKIKNLDVVVCSLGSKLLLQEISKVLIDLWSLGIRSCLIDASSMDDIKDKCEELRVSYSIILKDSYHGFAKIRNRESQEKKYPLSELADNMLKIIRSSNEGVTDSPNQTLIRSESKTGNIERVEKNEFQTDIKFIVSEKLPPNPRKRHENQIRSQLKANGVFKKIRGEVLILAMNFDKSVLKTIASFLEFGEGEPDRSMESIIERHPSHKKYIKTVCGHIHNQKSEKSNCIIILFGLADGSYQVLI